MKILLSSLFLGFFVGLSAMSLSAQTVSPLSSEAHEFIMAIDAEARVSDDGSLTISNADAVCLLLASGRGFFVTDTTDPRQMGFDPSFATTPQLERPEGVEPCVWVALNDANSEDEVRTLIQFDRIVDGVPRPAPLPLFINRAVSPILLGLDESAKANQIAQRFGELMLLGTVAHSAALRNYKGPIQVAKTADAQADMEAAGVLADAAQADMEASRVRVDAARQLIDGLRKLNRH